MVSIHESVKDATNRHNLRTLIDSFNPRICKRCDTYRERIDSFNPVSIHASVKDATYMDFISADNTEVSIHASVKDATYCSFWHY